MRQPHHTHWMSALPDDILISDINIPGSHNAAAIHPTRRTRWACQCHSITEQLENGIRLLDIRLKPKRRKDEESEFITCHGRLGLPKANEFQSFESLLEECSTFLKANPSETIIMTIQIDDWRRTKKRDRPQILQALKAQLHQLPLTLSPNLPKLQECRGKIYLINRINDDPELGVPLSIPDNTPGTTIAKTTKREYEVYVQDQYKHLNRRRPAAHKLSLTIKAFEEKAPGTVMLNFASATKPMGRFVYITKELRAYYSKNTSEKPQGWTFLDYALQEDLPNLIITSNYR